MKSDNRAIKIILSVLLILLRMNESLCWVVSNGQCHRHAFTKSSLWSSFDDTDFQDFDDEDVFTDDDFIDYEELEARLGDWDDRVARINTIHLVGRVGNSPEPRYFDDGKVVVNLSLACRRKYHYAERAALGIKSGEEETDWYGLELWGQTAEYVSKYIDKGARVGVVGTLQIDEWSDSETGQKRNKAKVIVREFDLLETKAEADLRRQNTRGPSLYTGDDDVYDPSTGSSGGFFD